MKFPRACKLEEAASTDKGRAYIQEPYLDIKDGVGTMVATDGRIMAAVPVEVDPADVPGHVNGDLLRTARAAQRREECPDIHLYTRGPEREGVSHETNFPAQWPSLFPKDAPGTVAVGIDTVRLYKLAQAMGTRGVVLHFIPNSETTVPALVLPKQMSGNVPACAEARGVIMLLGVDAPTVNLPVGLFTPPVVLNPTGVRKLLI